MHVSVSQLGGHQLLFRVTNVCFKSVQKISNSNNNNNISNKIIKVSE